MTYGEGGLTIEQVASLTVYQTRAILLRKRDKHGKLVRPGGQDDLPQHVIDSTDSFGNRRVTKKVPLGEAYVRAKMAKGLTKDKAVEQWEGYLKALKEERVALNEAKRGKRR